MTDQITDAELAAAKYKLAQLKEVSERLAIAMNNLFNHPFPKFKKGGRPHKQMTKYKVTTVFLPWPSGTVLALGTGNNEQYIPEGSIPRSPALSKNHHIPKLLELGWLEKIEEEKVKDYRIDSRSKGLFQEEKIFAVRRLSDGVEFKRKGECMEGEILEFKEKYNNLMVNVRTIGVETHWYDISEISPLPEKKVFFTTHDGVPIYKDDYYFVVHKTEFDVIGACQGDLKTDNSEQSAFIKFSTREAAEEWVIKNKPNVFSFDDVIYAHHHDFEDVSYEDWIMQLGRIRLGFRKPAHKDSPRANCPF